MQDEVLCSAPSAHFYLIQTKLIAKRIICVPDCILLPKDKSLSRWPISRTRSCQLAVELRLGLVLFLPRRNSSRGCCWFFINLISYVLVPSVWLKREHKEGTHRKAMFPLATFSPQALILTRAIDMAFISKMQREVKKFHFDICPLGNWYIICPWFPFRKRIVRACMLRSGLDLPCKRDLWFYWDFPDWIKVNK